MLPLLTFTTPSILAYSARACKACVFATEVMPRALMQMQHSQQVCDRKVIYSLYYIYIWVFPEMSFPRFDRLVLSDGGPLLIQYISDACVSSRQNDKQFFLYLKTNQCRLRGALLSWRYIGTWGWTVWGKWRKGKKSSCSEKSSSEKSSVESQKGHVVAHGQVVALEGRACAWACAKLAHDFAPALPKSSALRFLAPA